MDKIPKIQWKRKTKELPHTSDQKWPSRQDCKQPDYKAKGFK